MNAVSFDKFTAFPLQSKKTDKIYQQSDKEKAITLPHNESTPEGIVRRRCEFFVFLLPKAGIDLFFSCVPAWVTAVEDTSTLEMEIGVGRIHEQLIG